MSSGRWMWGTLSAFLLDGVQCGICWWGLAFLEGSRVRGEGRPGALLVLWGGYAPVVSSFVVLALCPLRLFSLVGLRWADATASPFVVPLAITLLFYRASALSRGVSYLKLEMGDTAARKLMGSCMPLHSSLDCRLRA